MDEATAKGLAIALVVLLALIFLGSFVWYMRTKPPKGCERIRKDETDCIGCKNVGCRLYRKKEDGPKDGPEE